MEIITDCCVGLDVHQNNVVACVLDGSAHFYKTQELLEQICYYH